MSLSTSHSSQLTRGYMIALISAVVLSTTAIFIRQLTVAYAMPALVLAVWREAIVALTLALVLRVLRPHLLRVERRHLRYLVLYGFVLAIFNSLWTFSVALNGAAVSTVLVYSSAGFTALLGWWLLNERLDWAKLLVIALSVLGCVLVAGAYDPAVWSSNILGILTGVLSGLLYAIYSLFGRTASQRGLNTWTSLLYIFAIGTVFLLSFNLLLGGILPGAATQMADFFWLGDALDGWGVLIALAVGPTLIGYGLYNLSLVYLPSSVANLIATTEPAFTAVIAYFLFNERLDAIQIGGSVMIVSGVIFLRLYEGRLMTRRVLPPHNLEASI